jgi:hypothetical protein
MENEKLFEFMEKIYVDLNSKMDSMDKKMDQGFKDIKQDIVRLENKVDDKTKALFDGYNMVYEKLTEVESKIKNISDNMEKQDIEVRIIKNIIKQ